MPSFWKALEYCKAKPEKGTATDCTQAHDTGAGVLIRTWTAEYGITTTYLPGHAIIDGKLLSKPLLEPSDQPGVTMGDRVAALEKALEVSKSEGAEYTGRMLKLTAQLEAGHAEELHQRRNLEGQVKLLERQLAEAQKALAAAAAANGLSLADDKRGFLSKILGD